MQHNRELHGNGDNGNTAVLGVTVAITPRDGDDHYGVTAEIVVVICSNTSSQSTVMHSLNISASFNIMVLCLEYI